MKKIKLTLTVVPNALGELIEYVEATPGISIDDMSMISPLPSPEPTLSRNVITRSKALQDPRLVMKRITSEKTPHGYEVIDTQASLFKLGVSEEFLLNRVCKAGTVEHSVKRAILAEKKKAAEERKAA